MRLAHQHLAEVRNQCFYKLLGSGGGNGFSVLPDWGTYVLLQTWESEKDFNHFKNTNPWLHKAVTKSKQVGVVKLLAYKSHGTWNKQQPFAKQTGNENAAFIAVLTRARIKPKLLHKFWKYVPTVSKHVSQFDGLVLAKGIGELPLVEQATFSIWNNAQLMQQFAYRDKQHAAMVKKTRELRWYSEELFARFEVLDMEGVYGETDLGKLFQNKKLTGSK